MTAENLDARVRELENRMAVTEALAEDQATRLDELHHASTIETCCLYTQTTPRSLAPPEIDRALEIASHFLRIARADLLRALFPVVSDYMLHDAAAALGMTYEEVRAKIDRMATRPNFTEGGILADRVFVAYIRQIDKCLP